MANTTDLEQLVPCQRGPTERGGYSIILSCLAVIVTSTWTALHLNLPGRSRTIRRSYYTPTLFGKVREFHLLPAMDYTTVRKMKWTLVMIIFPEFVFAHAVLELRMALDDFVKMDEMHVAMHKKGWCIEAGTRIFVAHDLLQMKWPRIENPFSTTWPWFRIVSKKKRQRRDIDAPWQSLEDEGVDDTTMPNNVQGAAVDSTLPDPSIPNGQAKDASPNADLRTGASTAEHVDPEIRARDPKVETPDRVRSPLSGFQ